MVCNTPERAKESRAINHWAREYGVFPTSNSRSNGGGQESPQTGQAKAGGPGGAPRDLHQPIGVLSTPPEDHPLTRKDGGMKERSELPAEQKEERTRDMHVRCPEGVQNEPGKR